MFISLPGPLLYFITLSLVIAYSQMQPSWSLTLASSSSLSSSPFPSFLFVLWLFTRIISYFFDICDGEHARVTQHQSRARHFYDHFLDIITYICDGAILRQLSPPYVYQGIIPSIVLVLATSSSMYVMFIAYYFTGVMIIPLSAHLLKWNFGLFLCGSVLVTGSTTILYTHDFGVAYFVTSALCFASVFAYGVENLATTAIAQWRNLAESSFWKRLYRVVVFFFILLGLPVLCTLASILLDAYMPHTLTHSLLVLVAFGSHLVSLHARQLLNLPARWYTIPSLLYLFTVSLSVVLLQFKACGIDSPALWQGQILALLFIAIWFVVEGALYLRRIIVDCGLTNFPIFILR